MNTSAPVSFVELEARVFPSELRTIVTMVKEGDLYGGAHHYGAMNCLGFENGETKYQVEKHGEELAPKGQMIQFIEKLDDGTVIPGLQSEQLVYILLDRHKKLNAWFPSAQNEQMLKGLQMFIDAAESRVKERMDRGVMGELKK